jgi:copper chaperone CopZ
MRLALLPAVLVVAGALLACRKESAPVETPPAAEAPPAVAQPWRGAGDTIEVTAWKLDCPGCVKKMKKDLGAIEGVVSVEADEETSGVRVKIADAAKRDEMIAKIRDAIHAQKKKVVGEDPT